MVVPILPKGRKVYKKHMSKKDYILGSYIILVELVYILLNKLIGIISLVVGILFSKISFTNYYPTGIVATIAYYDIVNILITSYIILIVLLIGYIL